MGVGNLDKMQEKINGVNGISEGNMNGPDQVIPADSYTTHKPDGYVKLRVTEKGLASQPPLSVPGLLNRAAEKWPMATALATKKADGKWYQLTFKEYKKRVRIVAKGFLKLGLERFHAVCILGINSEQWFLSDLAAIHAGGYAAGIYTTNSADACYHCLLSSRANICVVQDRKQLDKILSVRDKLPLLKAIVQWEGDVDYSIPGLYSWSQLYELGSREDDTKLDNILKAIAINQCCTLVYTSGTISSPKAVMLTHDNLTWDSYSLGQRVGDLKPTKERLVSFLPLSHVAAQMLDIYMTLSNGVAVYFAQPDALKGSLVQTLQEVRPTRFLSVPRVWEKMYEKISVGSEKATTLKKGLLKWAREQCNAYNQALIKGQSPSSLGYSLAKTLVLSKLHETLGLDKCTFFVTAAAPLSPDIKKFFLSLDIPIVDAFGMSESSGGHAMGKFPKFSVDASGELLDGTETMFADASSPNGPGELLMRGRHVFMGYLNDEAKTNEAFDEEGWLHSGDIGKIDSQNMLYITGRLKELIITAGGENVAPVIIEQAVHTELMHIGYAVVIGDKRKFLSILLTLKAKVDPETGIPLDELESEAKNWVASLGSKATTISEIVNTKDEAVYKAIEAGIIKANKQAISNAQKVQKFAILPADLSVFTGELGPTLKIKRNVVQEKYIDIIEGLYKD